VLPARDKCGRAQIAPLAFQRLLTSSSTLSGTSTPAGDRLVQQAG
jgi:hypothetical protein